MSLQIVEVVLLGLVAVGSLLGTLFKPKSGSETQIKSLSACVAACVNKSSTLSEKLANQDKKNPVVIIGQTSAVKEKI